MWEAVTYFLIKPEEADKRPSWVYKDVILRGAVEHGMPTHYIDKLRQDKYIKRWKVQISRVLYINTSKTFRSIMFQLCWFANSEGNLL